VEPDNKASQKLLEQIDNEKQIMTIPGTIEAEWATNPFMRLQ